MDRRIPEGIVAVTRELASSVATWCGAGRGRSLEEHEAAVLAAVRRALGPLLGAVLAETTPGLDRGVRWGKAACPGCGRATAPWTWRERTLATRCGTVAVPVLRYHCRRCRRGWGGLEAVLGVAPRARLSPGLAAWVARLGGLTDFREAADLLAEYAGVALGAETVRRHTERLGAAPADAEDAAATRGERTREAAGPVDPAPGDLVVELDGVMARYPGGWHEVKVGAVGGIVDGATTALSYVAAREGPDRFGPRLLAEAARRGALEVVGWDGPLLDALAAAAAAAPPGSPAADLLRRERASFRANAARMAYPAFRAAGLPIGSGAVESAARHVVQLRMKRPGMRWADHGGRAIAALRATMRSGRPLAA